MKKKMFSILGAAALLALAACTATPTPGSSTSGSGNSAGSSIICPDPGSSIVTPSDVYCNITFKDGDSIIGSQAVKKGEKATSYTPSKDGYEFAGWYSDASLLNSFDFGSAIGANTVVYAKFTSKVPAQYPIKLSKDGTKVTYGYEGDTHDITLGEKSIYIDGSLSDEEIEGFDYVYNSFKQAMSHLTDGTEAEPMNVYIAPHVYWIHNPDSVNTTDAWGMHIKCANLHITGLTDDARNVVIAGNYGHNEGYDGGNWTMFDVKGDGLELKNLTFGDYCNVDLDYPLDPSQSRKKRTDNVTQGQIASYNGDKLYCNNVRFISRLNMMPFNNSQRALYVNCHMESTDDSLNGSSGAVYVGCDFEFYASKPWGGSSGVTLLDCDMKLCHINKESDKDTQYLAKGAGRFNVIDSRFSGEAAVADIGWSDILSDTYRSYYSNVTYNGQQIKMDNGGAAPDASVDLTGTDALKAYKLTKADGTVIYNVYNLLHGTDGWDPLNQKAEIEALGDPQEATTLIAYTAKTENPWWGTQYTASGTLESKTDGKDSVTINADVTGPDSTKDYSTGLTYTFSIKDENKDVVTLTPSEDGKSCTVTGINDTEEARKVIVTVKTSTGLEGVVSLNVKPSVLPAPAVTVDPVISQNNDGTASVNYTLDLGQRKDMSRITWYTCDDAAGTNPIEIAVGRDSENPLKSIKLSKAYVGKYLKAEIEPKNIRSNYGEKVTAISAGAVTDAGITSSDSYSVDLSTMPTVPQQTLANGYWTMDSYMPNDCKDGYIPLDGTEVSTKYSAKVGGKTFGGETENATSAWAYGTGNKNGFLNYTGLYSIQRGARLRYTPVENYTTGDMDVTVKLAPGKTAGQGFGSDYQYLDTMIKFNTGTLTGYGLRIYRRSGDSCEFVLMQYKDGLSKEITDPIQSSAYLTEVTVHLWTEGTKFNAHVESSKPQPETAKAKGYAEKVDLTADIAASSDNGFCLISTSTVGDNTTYIGSIDLSWKKAAW